jgi:hypothetical protein
MKKKNRYNWHFWIPSWKIQVIVEAGSYFQSIQHLNDCLRYYNRPAPEFEFQFGQKI